MKKDGSKLTTMHSSISFLLIRQTFEREKKHFKQTFYMTKQEQEKC